MPVMANYDRGALDDLLNRQHGVIARGQALACDMSLSAVRRRVRDGGPWRVVLPGIYVTHTGPCTDEQLDMAALLHGGPRSVLTGHAALRRHGIHVQQTGIIDVLVPAAIIRRDAGFVRLHRTNRMPDSVCVTGRICFALTPRAIADAARSMTDLREVRAVVAGAVQRGRCPIPLLAEELAEGPVQGSARFRQALAEVAVGIRSVAEADLRKLIIRAQLPEPMFNPDLFADGKFIARPDCWWPEAGVAVEVDSREWHLSPHDWERTLARHVRMGACGIVVLHFTPRQIRTDPGGVVSAIRSALAAGQSRGTLAIRTVPAA